MFFSKCLLDVIHRWENTHLPLVHEAEVYAILDINYICFCMIEGREYKSIPPNRGWALGYYHDMTKEKIDPNNPSPYDSFQKDEKVEASIKHTVTSS